MIKVYDDVDNLINVLNDTNFVHKMKENKDIILKNNLINTNDVTKLYKDSTIHEYIECQNELDLYIYYLNTELNKILKGDL